MEEFELREALQMDFERDMELKLESEYIAALDDPISLYPLEMSGLWMKNKSNSAG